VLLELLQPPMLPAEAGDFAKQVREDVVFRRDGEAVNVHVGRVR